MAAYLGKKPRKKAISKLPSIDASYKWFNGSSWFTRGGPLDCLDQKFGSNNPKWKEKMSNGSDAGSAYQRTFVWKVIQDQPASFQWESWKSALKRASWRYEITGAYPMAHVSKLTHDYVDGMDYVRSQAKLAFLNKVNDEMSMFSGGVFLGELRHTIRMIKRPLSGLQAVTKKYFRTASKLHKGAKKRLRNKKWRKPHEDESFLNALSSAYLEWTYGVAPLLNDMERIGQAVGSIVEKPLADIRVQVTIPAPELRPYSQTFLRGESTVAPIMVHLLNRLQASVHITGAIRGDVRSSNVENVEKLGLSLNQFVPTAWELIPYSFVSDYVVNIGQVLGAAFTATYALRYVWQTEKIRQQNECTCIPILGLPGNPKSFKVSFAAAAIERFQLKRLKPDLSVSIQDLHFQDPTVKHAVNTAVLGFSKYRALKDLR